MTGSGLLTASRSNNLYEYGMDRLKMTYTVLTASVGNIFTKLRLRSIMLESKDISQGIPELSGFQNHYCSINALNKRQKWIAVVITKGEAPGSSRPGVANSPGHTSTHYLERTIESPR